MPCVVLTTVCPASLLLPCRGWWPPAHPAEDQHGHCWRPVSGPVSHLRVIVVSLGVARSASLRMRIRYCVILVRRCLFLCTRNLGQCWRCSSTCRRGAGTRQPSQCLQSGRPAACTQGAAQVPECGRPVHVCRVLGPALQGPVHLQHAGKQAAVCQCLQAVPPAQQASLAAEKQVLGWLLM